MLGAALFRTGKPGSSSNTHQQENGQINIYPIKIKEQTIWMNLKNMMLKKGSQTHNSI